MSSVLWKSHATGMPVRLGRVQAVRQFIAFALLLALVGAGSVARAATLNVPAQYHTIQAAIDAANTADIVLVAPGTYTGPGNVDLTLRGLITVMSSGGAQNTIIDCQGSAATPHRAFTCNLAYFDTRTVFQGFTVKNGYADNGGAASITLGSPIIQDCVFTHNTSASNGGALFMDLGAAALDFTGEDQLLINPTITGCTFDHNVAAGGSGGAIYFQFDGYIVNSAPNSDYLHLIVLNTKIDSCVFDTNFSPNSGGAIVVYNASPCWPDCNFSILQPVTNEVCDISHSKFLNNTAGSLDAQSGSGGAILCEDFSGPGIQIHYYNGLFVTGSYDVFLGNVAGGYGAAIGTAGWDHNAPGVGFSNCSFSGNNSHGGTIGAPYRSGYGGVSNSIFWGDLCDVIVTTPDGYYGVDYSILQGGDIYGSWGNIPYTDPLYLSATDLRVAYDSPAINALPGGVTVGAYPYAVSVTANPIASTAGTVFTGQVATFTDTNGIATPVSAFTGAIDWGDGSTSAATITGSGSGYFVSGTHTYTASGSHPLTVKITADTNLPKITGSGTSTATVAPGAVDHLAVVLPANATAGTPVSFTVTAVDVYNNPVAGYVGTVHFTTSDGRAAVPSNPVIHGAATLSAIFRLAGTQTITATDTGSPTITGSGSANVTAGPAAKLRIGGRTTAIGRVPYPFTVGAVDANGNAVPTYSGIVRFTSSDPLAVLPADSALTGSPNFTAIFKTPGTQTITVTDTANPAITGVSPAIAVGIGPAAVFAVTIPATTVAGVGQPLTITPQDQYGNPVAFTGTAHITCTDPHAADVDGGAYTPLPVDVALTGPKTVSMALYTVGNHSFTVKSTGTPLLVGSSDGITVTPAATVAFRFNIRGTSAAGQPLQFSLQAIDAFGNPTPAYNGMIHFTSNDPSAALPANVTLVNGVGGPYTATLNTAGTKTIVATDTTNPLVTSTAAVIVYRPAVRFQVITPASATAGVPISLHVVALDSNSNTAQGYTGTVVFTSTDAQASLPASVALNHGVGDFPATLKTIGRHTVTATDSVSSSITGRSGNISVSANTASALTVTIPSSASTSRATSGTVTARDAYGNAATSYVGTVHFTSSDPLATLPANTSLVNGMVTFPVKFGTVGSQTVSVTDGTLSATSIVATITLR